MRAIRLWQKLPNVQAPDALFPRLATGRLTLREIVMSDAPALLATHGDREAMRWLGSDSITSLKQAEAMVTIFAGWRKPAVSGVTWAIVRNRDHRFVGTCGLFVGTGAGSQTCPL
ncbi:GNAT family N-acetyltransferase [Variovorax sp. J22P168]|uniref:GNAT family N-acetyltransferase n=1 Tax=Variovorax jilinensis TaxID=3053513 RepID=UPI0025760BCE|nr:GNAT family N-acetyltransferase [Variovorax sp. J22P168]MDM0015020.1 GNAT family N-acetyltransferase [Variovorax sp. J22P168]